MNRLTFECWQHAIAWRDAYARLCASAVESGELRRASAYADHFARYSWMANALVSAVTVSS